MRAAVTGEVARVADAAEGNRNHTLFIAACALGQLKQFRRVNGHLHLTALRTELRGVTAENVVPDHQNDTVNAA